MDDITTICSGHHQHNIGIHDLPTELLICILEAERPLCPRDQFWCTSLGGSNKITLHYQMVSKAYSRLRLVSLRWHEITTPLLFQQGLLMTTLVPTSSIIDRVARFFDIHAPYLSVLTIVGGFRGLNRQSYGEVAERLGKELNRCSKLTSLTCTGFSPAFLNRRWMPAFAPKLAGNITSLAIAVNPSDSTLFNALKALGNSLQSLLIYELRPRRTELPLSPFHLPKTFPNLRHVGWHSSKAAWHHAGSADAQLAIMSKIFSRIVVDPVQNPLKSVFLVIYQPSSLITMLSIKHRRSNISLGANLTALRLLFFREYFEHAFETALVTVFAICQNLLEFSYDSDSKFSGFRKGLLKHLPPLLQGLCLPVLKPNRGNYTTTTDIAGLLKRRQLPDLCRLELHTKAISEYKFDDPELLSVSNDLQLISTIDKLRPKDGTYLYRHSTIFKLTLTFPLPAHM